MKGDPFGFPDDHFGPVDQYRYGCGKQYKIHYITILGKIAAL